MFREPHDMKLDNVSYDQGIPLAKLREMQARAEHGYAKAVAAGDTDRIANALRILNERKADVAKAEAKQG